MKNGGSTSSPKSSISGSLGSPRILGSQRSRIVQARPSGPTTCRALTYSHSMVDGGFDEMSSATRLMPGISLMMRLEIVSSRS